MCYFFLKAEERHQRLTLPNRSFDNFSKVFKKIIEENCFLVKLQNVGHNLVKNELFHGYVLRILLKS